MIVLLACFNVGELPNFSGHKALIFKFMQRFCVILLLVLFTISNTVSVCTAQRIIRDHGFFKNLLKDSTGIFDISTPHYTKPKSLEINDVPFQKTGATVKYIRNQTGLYAFAEGTGRVYQIKSGAGELHVDRLDSTIFFGYNFGSYEFSYHDTLFSYGGYGYWHHNGHLRYFMPKKGEWELAYLSREITSRNDNGERNNIWFDANDGQLYVVKAVNQPDSIYVLDMSGKQWKSLGLRLLPENFTYILLTPWGLLGQSDNGSQRVYILLNFNLNQIQQLQKSKSESLSGYWDFNAKVYMKDSTVYLTTKSNPDELVTVPLSKNDFTSTGKKIYEKIPKKTVINSLTSTLKNHWITSLGIVLSFCIGGLLCYQYMKSKNPRALINGNGSSNGLSKVFDEKEKDLIKLVLDNSINNTPTSIEAINHILGIGEKPHDLQKKHRSDTQSSINNKYRYATGKSESLLVSKRTELDKRSFEYFIEKNKINEILAMLNI